MFTQTPTAFLGKKFEFQYAMPRAKMKKMVARAAGSMAFKWKVNKKTRMVVLGIDADEADAEAARSGGLMVLDFGEWLGLGVASEAPTVAAYLGGVMGAGFRLTTTCNEADGFDGVHSISLVRCQDRQALSRAHMEALSGRFDVQRDVENTLVDWVREHHGKWLAEGPDYEEGRHRDMRSFYQPDADEAPVFWSKLTAATGSSDHGAVIAVRQDRTLPTEVLEYRILKRAAYTFCFRCNDAPVDGNVRSLLLLGGLEQDQSAVTFVPIEIIHT